MTQSTIFPQERVTIVAVLNLTPDSFSDGGRFVRAGADLDLDAAVAEAEALVASGAGMLDVGGESTRPGAGEVSIEDADFVASFKSAPMPVGASP